MALRISLDLSTPFGRLAVILLVAELGWIVVGALLLRPTWHAWCLVRADTWARSLLGLNIALASIAFFETTILMARTITRSDVPWPMWVDEGLLYSLGGNLLAMVWVTLVFGLKITRGDGD